MAMALCGSNEFSTDLVATFGIHFLRGVILFAITHFCIVFCSVCKCLSIYHLFIFKGSLSMGGKMQNYEPIVLRFHPRR